MRSLPFRRWIPAASFACVVLGSTPVDAQSGAPGGPPPEALYEPPFVGFYLGVGLGPQLPLAGKGLCSVAAGCLDGPGAGLDVFAGMRFSPWFKLQAGYDAYWHDSDSRDTAAVVQTLRLDGRATVPVRSNFEPFGQFGIGLYTFGDEFAADTGGPGFQAGGGVDLALGRFVSLGLTLLYRGTWLATTGTARPANPDVDEAVYVHFVTAMLEASFGGGI